MNIHKNVVFVGQTSYFHLTLVEHADIQLSWGLILCQSNYSNYGKLLDKMEVQLWLPKQPPGGYLRGLQVEKG